MLNKKSEQTSLAATFKNNSLVAIITTGILISVMISYIEFHSFSKRAEKIESEYLTSKRALIKQEVLRVTQHIERERVNIEKNLKNNLKNKTNEAHVIATKIYNKFKGKLPDKKIKKLIIEALRPIRFFKNTGYYFIHSLEGDLLLHAIFPDKEGSNRLNFQNSTGQYVVKDLLSIVSRSEEGFLSYKYPSIDNIKKEKTKLSFVKHFKPYNWSIGSGDYLENIEKNTQNNILNYIQHIRYGENSYIFVVDYNGNILMNASQKHMIGKNMSKLVDPNGVNVFLEERKAVKNPDGDFIYYVWNKPSSSSPSPKMTFMKGIPDWQWMIGTGLYIDDAKAMIALQKETLKSELIIKVFYIFLIVLVSGFLISFISHNFTQRFTGELGLFLSFFHDISRKTKKINLDSFRFIEFKNLAEFVNRMLDKKVEAEKSLQESESNLKEAQKITHFGSWKLDIKNNILKWSDEVYRIFGLEPGECTPSYEKSLSFVHSDDRHSVDEAYHLSIKNKVPYDIEHRICLNDGTIKYVREHAETFYDDNNEAIHSSGTIQDITELKEKEEQLRRTLKMDALGKLTGGIAHDYNNMMGIVLGYTELLMSKVAGDDKAIEYVVQIRSAGERAKALTDKLMTFSRYKSSETEIVNINEQLQEQKHLLEKTLTARIKLILKLSDDLWLTKIDKGDFNDAIINMSINALHAIEANGTMEIITHNKTLNVNDAQRLQLPTGEYISVSLVDNGKGMDTQTITKIFDPFFSTKGEMGTGLGLSQVYGFVERCGGSIKVLSKIGQGTEFVLYFPRLNTKDSDKEKVEPVKISHIEHGQETILIVDDEKPLCDMASELLSSHGYQVIKAYSTKQALEILKTQPVDIVFSDVIMPEMSGYELASEISKLYPNIIIQLTSGFNYPEDLNLELDIEKMDILAKPYSNYDLLQQMRKILNKE